MSHVTFWKGEGKSRVERRLQWEADKQANWKAVCAVVDARDGRRCRHCGKPSDPHKTGLLERGHRHHIVYRSAGGADGTSNVVTLCAVCHDMEHVKRTLRLEGDADGKLTFWRIDDAGQWFISKQESAPGVVLRD